jgi:hypothetical protein
MDKKKRAHPDHPQSWGEAQDDIPDYVSDTEDGRPNNREVENENMKPPKKEGEPPRPATEPRNR